jgi:hypothetical protein
MSGKLPPKVLEYFKEQGAIGGKLGGKLGGKIGGRKGGKLGGPARAAKLTPERRAEIARKAAQARWAKGENQKGME